MAAVGNEVTGCPATVAVGTFCESFIFTFLLFLLFVKVFLPLPMQVVLSLCQWQLQTFEHRIMS
jgi:hypothetical protein